MSSSTELTLVSSLVIDSQGLGDVSPLPQTQNSTDSLPSIFLPRRIYVRNTNENRRAVIARYESGRTTTATGFYLCMMSVLLLCTGAGLISTTTFLLIYRNPYTQITEGIFHSEAINFTLCAGIVSILCWWICWIAHDNIKNYIFFPLLIVVLTISLSMLLTSIGIGVSLKSRLLIFDKSSSKPVKLASSHHMTLLNETLTTSLKLYWENEVYRTSWDRVQQRLKCCGINQAKDWGPKEKIPESCYEENGENVATMTISYGKEITTSRGFGLFWRLLSRWRGSIYKLIWADLIIYIIIYFILNSVYRYALNEDGQR
nr:uncharacterized protein LOC111421416 [Onthophagus taurus]